MTADTSRRLDRCGVCTLTNEHTADEMFGCTVPADIDMDSASGHIVMDGIARDKAKCEGCPERKHR
jgi:hypothetical protein